MKNIINNIKNIFNTTSYKKAGLIVTTQTTIMVISIAKQIKNRVNQNQLPLSHARLV
jgi:hypothetical protein